MFYLHTRSMEQKQIIVRYIEWVWKSLFFRSFRQMKEEVPKKMFSEKFRIIFVSSNLLQHNNKKLKSYGEKINVGILFSYFSKIFLWDCVLWKGKEDERKTTSKLMKLHDKWIYSLHVQIISSYFGSWKSQSKLWNQHVCGYLSVCPCVCSRSWVCSSVFVWSVHP